MKAGQSRKYYTLALLDGTTWSAQFGDYDREVVKQEAEDSYEGERTTILKTGDTQAEIDAAIARLNGKGK